MTQLVDELKKIEHGFKHIQKAGDILLNDNSLDHFNITFQLLSGSSYQERMLATYILGKLWALSCKADSNTLPKIDAVKLLKTRVADDDNWRVQEMLAKAFDEYCKIKGYENSLPTINEWLGEKKANLKRAVIEGLRIWTSRPYFKQNPAVAIEIISKHKNDESEYVRKSVGNALRDIGKKYPELVENEIAGWDLTNTKIAFTYKLVE